MPGSNGAAFEKVNREIGRIRCVSMSSGQRKQGYEAIRRKSMMKETLPTKKESGSMQLQTSHSVHQAERRACFDWLPKTPHILFRVFASHNVLTDLERR